MIARFAFAAVLSAAVLGLAAAQEKKPEEKKKDEPRKGTVTGVLTAKGDNWVEVKADGEDKARKYVYPPKDEALTKAVKDIATDTRVTLDWVFGERFRLVKIEVLKKAGKDDKKPAEKKDEPRKGTVAGVVTDKGDNFIEVKADGEEKARKYVPHWKGGLPKDGGGPDKDMLAKIKDTPLHARVKLDWEFEERARVVKIEVIKKPDAKTPEDKKDEKRSGTISGEIKSMKEQNNNVTIEVLAAGEEKARPYFVQYDAKIKGPIPDVLKLVRAAKVGDRVAFDWEATNHGPAIVKFEVLKKTEKK